MWAHKGRLHLSSWVHPCGRRGNNWFRVMTPRRWRLMTVDSSCALVLGPLCKRMLHSRVGWKGVDPVYAGFLFASSSWVQLVVAHTCLRMDKDLTLWWVWFTKTGGQTRSFSLKLPQDFPTSLSLETLQIFPQQLAFLKNESEAQLSAQTNKHTQSGAIFHVLEAGCPGRWMRAQWPLLRGMEGRDHSVCATDAYQCVQVYNSTAYLPCFHPISVIFQREKPTVWLGDEDHLIPSLCEI